MNEREKMLITKYDLLFESRLTKVETTMSSMETDMREIRSDLRWMLGLLIGFSTTIVGIMAHGFKWI